MLGGGAGGGAGVFNFDESSFWSFLSAGSVYVWGRCNLFYFL